MKRTNKITGSNIATVQITNAKIPNNSIMKEMIQTAIDEAIDKKFKHILDDISYRIGVLYDTTANALGVGIGRVGSRDLNLATHQLDGFTFTDNSPSSGYIAWSDCNIVYKGTSYTIANGNTNKKYIWWDYDATPNTAFQTSDTKPTLSDDDVMIAINNGGTHQLVIGQGRLVNGAIILDGTIGSNEIANNAVSATKIIDGAISSTKLASGAVTSSALASGAVTSTAIASGAVGSSAIAANAVTSAAIANGAITSGKLGTGAVDSNALASNAVTSAKIASGAVGTTALADDAVTTAKIATNAVTSTELADNAVIGAKISAGAVATNKLNLAQHLIF